ncbi:putative reverse transcriptase domain-containing protein [Tanacetum coccineum]
MPTCRTAKKLEEINNFQQEPDETLYQAWERFKELLLKCPQHYLIEKQEVILFYNGLDVPTRQILDSRGVVPTKTAADAKTTIQEMAEYSQKWHNGTSKGRSTKTSDRLAAIQAQLNNLRREIKKVNENIYAAQVGCKQCKGPHYTKDFPQKEEGKALEEAYYTQFGGPFQGGGYRATAPGYYQRNNANPSFQERRQSMEYTLSKFMSESAKRHEENSNLIIEIRASTDAAIRNQRASIKTLEIQIGQMSKEKDPGSFTLPCFINDFCFDNALIDLVANISVMPISTYLNLGLSELAHTRLTVVLADRTVKYPKGIAKNVLVGIGKFTFPIDFIILDIPEDVKVPLILERLFLSTARAKIDVYKRKITLRVEEEKIIFKSVKTTSSIIKMVYMLSLRERMELDLEARKFHNSIMKNKMVYKGNNVVGALMNVPIFIRTFSVMIDFAVLEDMDAYRDNEKGDIIFGEPFLREVGVKTKWFEGIITLYNGDNEVTYQMVRSHPKFKHHTNEQCNKIPLLLKVSEKDKINRISHAYQKLKGFYKGVLNLGPDFIRVSSMEEWLIRENISMHELE